MTNKKAFKIGDKVKFKSEYQGQYKRHKDRLLHVLWVHPNNEIKIRQLQNYAPHHTINAQFFEYFHNEESRILQ